MAAVVKRAFAQMHLVCQLHPFFNQDPLIHGHSCQTAVATQYAYRIPLVRELLRSKCNSRCCLSSIKSYMAWSQILEEITFLKWFQPSYQIRWDGYISRPCCIPSDDPRGIPFLSKHLPYRTASVWGLDRSDGLLEDLKILVVPLQLLGPCC